MQRAPYVVPQQQMREAAPEAAATVELGEVKRILVRRRRLILGVATLLTLAALLYGLLTPALYSSTTEIIIDPRDRQVVSNDVNPSSVSPDGGITQVESQASVVQSTGVLLRAIEATRLTEDPEFGGEGALDRLLGTFGLGPAAEPSEADKQTRTLESLRRRLAVKRADKVLVIDVTVTAKAADKAAMLANAIAEAYLVDQASARSDAASAASKALTARLEEQRKRVEQAENAVARYKAENDMVMASGDLVSSQELTDLNAQLTLARSRSAAAKAQVDQLRKSGSSPDATPEVMRSSVITQLRTQEAQLVDQIASLKLQLGPRHPAMKAAEAQLTDLRRLVASELSRIVASAEVDYDRARANEEGLRSQVASLKNQSLDTDQASVRLRELQRDLDSVRSVYAAFLTRAQETREQINVDSTNARIISPALPAQKKSWPPTGLLIVGALFGGLGLGAGLALIAEYLAPTVLSPACVQAEFGAPVIGILPVRGTRFGRGALSAGDSQPLSGNAANIAGLALRRLFGRRPPTAPTIPSILLTSAPSTGAERAHLVGLMASTAASRGSRVLVIDADFAKTSSSKELGLLDVLRGECAFEAAIRYKYNSYVAHLGTGRSSAFLEESKALWITQHILIQARRSFELLIIDGGAAKDNLLASPLVAMADEIIVVAELNATPISEVAATAQAVSVMGRSLTGALLVDRAMRA